MVAATSEHVCDECVKETSGLVVNLVKMIREVRKDQDCRDYAVDVLEACGAWYSKVFAGTMLAMKCEYLKKRPDDELERYANDLQADMFQYLEGQATLRISELGKGDPNVQFSTISKATIGMLELGSLLSGRGDTPEIRRRLAIGICALLVGVLSKDVESVREVAIESIKEGNEVYARGLTAAISQSIVDFYRKNKS